MGKQLHDLARRVRYFRPHKVTDRIRQRRLGLTGTHLDVFRARLPLSDSPVILECGANTGSDTNKFLKRWPTARVHCFEPEPRAIEAWRANVHSERAELFEVALALEDGETVFFRSSGRAPFATPDDDSPWNQSGSIRRPTGHLEQWPWVKFEEEITVVTRSLDSWADEHGIGSVDLIWADVQGAEGDLVRGGRETLARTKYLYTEIGDLEWYEGQISLAALLELLPGWKVLRKFRGDVLLANPSPA